MTIGVRKDSFWAMPPTDRTGHRHYKGDPPICKACPLLASLYFKRQCHTLDHPPRLGRRPRALPTLTVSRHGASTSTSGPKRGRTNPLQRPASNFTDTAMRFRGLLAVTFQCLLAAAAQNIAKMALALNPRAHPVAA